MNNNIYYAGIGSRETPDEVLELFTNVAKYFAKQGFILRSGHADGADMAFESGCNEVKGLKEIYIPWNGFNNSASSLVVVENGKAFEIAQQFHPYWHNLKVGAKKLHARNVHQVLGVNFDEPADFIICWTKGGKEAGGTAQAIRIAKHYNVPICNVGKYKSVDDMKNEIRTFLKSLKLK